MAEPGSSRDIAFAKATIIVLLCFEEHLLGIRLLGSRRDAKIECYHPAQVGFGNNQPASDGASFGRTDGQERVLVSCFGTTPGPESFATNKRFPFSVQHRVGR